MEVHHHSSHAAGSHQSAGKKKWSHYFWEFIMLFLAVTIGFYAENLREVNKHRHEANNNMHSLLSDLQNDVHLFDSVIDRNDYSIAMADTLVSLLHNDLSNTDEIYFAARATTANIGYFYTNTKSFEQMKGANLLRLVRPRELLDSIGTYYATFLWLESQVSLLRMKLDQIHKGNIDLFDAYVFQQMMMLTNSQFVAGNHIVINHPVGHPALLTKDPKIINGVNMNYHYYLTTARFYRAAAEKLRGIAQRLIEWIKREYGFD